MASRSCPFFVVLLLALTLGGSLSARAQGVPAERASVRVRYGLAFREGAQEAGPAVTYSGMTPNDVALGVAAFGEGWLGAWAGVQREGLSLLRGREPVTGGGLWRASVGPAARVLLGPVRAEVSAGYGFAQLPVFSSNSGQVRLVPTARHAALVGARVLVPLPWSLRAEVRGELPVAIGSSSGGFAAGGALLVPLPRRGEWEGALVLEYQSVRDALTTADGAVSRQVIHRAGVALELSLGAVRASARPETGELVPSVVEMDSGGPLPGASVVLTAGGVEQAPRASPEPRVGALRVSVVDARSGQPLPGAAVSVGPSPLLTDATGQVLVEGLGPGPLEVEISAEGFRATQEAVLIVTGTETELPVSLVSVREGVLATLSGQVRSVRKGKPLKAWLVIPEANIRRRTDARGSFQVQLKQGRYRLVFSAPGHLSQTKVVTVRDGEQAIFNVDLFPKHR